MGCDIHSVAIDANGKPILGGLWADGKTANPDSDWLDDEGEPFGWRIYGVFAFLAGVRNYSDITPISEPRGLPEDFESGRWEDEHDGWIGSHSFSWLSLAELEAVDYDQLIEDRRVTRQVAPNMYYGGTTCQPGEGKQETLREFLGEGFFKDIAELRRIGADRVAFGFDS